MNTVLDRVLQAARQLSASDVHLKAGLPPIFRIKGELRTVRDVPPLSREAVQEFALAMMNQRQREIFEKTCALIRSLVAGGAEMILPLGGAIIPYVVDPADLARATGAPVINTKIATIRFAEMCVTFGMTQSPLTYPRGKLSHAVENL